MRFKKFHALGQDGLADVGKKMENGDIFINKWCPDLTEEARALLNQGMLKEPDYKQQPEVYKNVLPAYVDRVILTSTQEESYMIKVMQRQTRVPEVGDKFSSRHG